MLFLEDLKEVRTYIDDVVKEMQRNKYGNKLSNGKKDWLVFCITGIIAVGVVCWKKFELLILDDSAFKNPVHKDISCQRNINFKKI